MAGKRGWHEATDEQGHHWLIIDPTPELALKDENEDLRAQLAAAAELNATFSRRFNELLARFAFLAGRLRRLRAWIKRLPKPAGARRKAKVGKRREQQQRAAAKVAAAAKAAAAEAERSVPMPVRRKMQAQGVRQFKPDGSVEEYTEVKITPLKGAK